MVGLAFIWCDPKDLHEAYSRRKGKGKEKAYKGIDDDDEKEERRLKQQQEEARRRLQEERRRLQEQEEREEEEEEEEEEEDKDKDEGEEGEDLEQAQRGAGPSSGKGRKKAVLQWMGGQGRGGQRIDGVSDISIPTTVSISASSSSPHVQSSKYALEK